MEENEIVDYLEKNHECYDRFTFDSHMRFLLRNGYDNEEAKDMILAHCAMSAITFQERIHNEYYRRISVGEELSGDLKVEFRKAASDRVNEAFRRSNRHN